MARHSENDGPDALSEERIARVTTVAGYRNDPDRYRVRRLNHLELPIMLGYKGFPDDWSIRRRVTRRPAMAMA